MWCIHPGTAGVGKHEAGERSSSQTLRELLSHVLIESADFMLSNREPLMIKAQKGA